MLTAARLTLFCVAGAVVTAQAPSASPTASQSAEPIRPSEATAPVPFAPAVLSWLVPAEIGGVDIIALDLSPTEVQARLEEQPALMEMLAMMDRGPADVHMAEAFSSDAPGTTSYWIELMRVDGVEGRETLRQLGAADMWAAGISDDPAILIDFADAGLAAITKRMEGGIEVFSSAEDGATTFGLAYAQGDVLYLVDAEGGLDTAEFMAAARFGGDRMMTGGIAVTAPRSWTAELTAPTTHPWLYSRATIDAGPAWSGVAYLHDAEFSCSVIDVTAYAGALGFGSVSDAVAWELEVFDDATDDPSSHLLYWFVDDPTAVTSEIMELPSGRTGVIDTTDPEWWNSRTYVLTDRERWMYLVCSDTFEPPEDRWLSIAETFEFLGPVPSSPTH